VIKEKDKRIEHLNENNRCDNSANIWFVTWPDGSVSIAAANSFNDAVRLFNYFEDVLPEMIQCWNEPEMLLDFNYNIEKGRWEINYNSYCKINDLLDQLSPIIAEAHEKVYELGFDDENGLISKEGQTILKTALKKYCKKKKEEFDCFVDVHKKRCRDKTCLFCKYDQIEEKKYNKDKDEQSGIT
jgi:hypothetical protein